MTPNRIHISEKMAKEYLYPESMFQNAYILESEHNRLVEVLKNRIRALEKLIPQNNEITTYDRANLSSSEMGLNLWW